MLSSTHLFKRLDTGVLPVNSKIGLLYRDLSECLDNVRERLTRECDPRFGVCLAVLEDDLVVLLEECCERLIGDGWEQDDGEDLLPFMARAETIVDEVTHLLGPIRSMPRH